MNSGLGRGSVFPAWPGEGVSGVVERWIWGSKWARFLVMQIPYESWGFSNVNRENGRITWARSKFIHLTKQKCQYYCRLGVNNWKKWTPRRAGSKKKTSATQQENKIFDFLNTPWTGRWFLLKNEAGWGECLNLCGETGGWRRVVDQFSGKYWAFFVRNSKSCGKTWAGVSILNFDDGRCRNVSPTQGGSTISEKLLPGAGK